MPKTGPDSCSSAPGPAGMKLEACQNCTINVNFYKRVEVYTENRIGSTVFTSTLKWMLAISTRFYDYDYACADCLPPRVLSI